MLLCLMEQGAWDRMSAEFAGACPTKHAESVQLQLLVDASLLRHISEVPDLVMAGLGEGRPAAMRVLLLHDTSWAWKQGQTAEDFIAYNRAMSERAAMLDLETVHVYPDSVFPADARWRLMACHRSVWTQGALCQNFFYSEEPSALPGGAKATEELKSRLEQLRLHGHLQADLMGALALTESLMARHERQMAALKRVLEQLDPAEGVERTLQATLERLLDLLDMEMGIITIHDARTGDARTVERCREGVDAEAMRNAELRQDLSAQALQQQRVVWIRDCADGPDMDEEEMTLRSYLASPLMNAARKEGVLELFGASPRAFTVEELQVVSAISRQLGVALENHRLYRQFLRSERQFKDTFDSIPDIITIQDRQFRIIEVNRATCVALERTPEELVGRFCYEVLRGLDSPCEQCRPMEGQVMPCGQVSDWNPQLLNGSFFVSSSGPITNEKGEWVGVLHLGRNVTAERSLLRKLGESERLAVLGQLISSVAHEVKNPLTGVLGFAELLTMRSNLDPETAELVKYIHQEARRAADVVNNLLAFARKRGSSRTNANMNEIVRTCIQVRAHNLHLSRIEVKLDLQEDLPPVLVDVSQIQQVMMNLISNAYDAIRGAGRPQGRLVVCSRRVGALVQVWVQDDGPGIAPEVLENLFQAFVTTKPAGEGTGLGLSICKTIMREHGGNIEAESQVGSGATFTLTLPVSQAKKAIQPKEDTSLPAQHQGRILVVDDEEVVCKAIKAGLGSRVRAIDTALSGAQALSMLDTETYDLVVSDIVMPNMSGMELYRQVKARRKLPFLFMTGDMSRETREFLQREKVPVLPKPFTQRVLLNAVLDAMGAGGTPPAVLKEVR